MRSTITGVESVPAIADGSEANTRVPATQVSATLGGSSASRVPASTTRSARRPGGEPTALGLLATRMGGAGRVGAQPVFVGDRLLGTDHGAFRGEPCHAASRGEQRLVEGTRTVRRTGDRHAFLDQLGEGHPRRLLQLEAVDRTAHVVHETGLHDAHRPDAGHSSGLPATQGATRAPPGSGGRRHRSPERPPRTRRVLRRPRRCRWHGRRPGTPARPLRQPAWSRSSNTNPIERS